MRNNNSGFNFDDNFDGFDAFNNNSNDVESFQNFQNNQANNQQNFNYSNEMSNQYTDDNQESSGTKKTAIMVIILGVIIILVVLFAGRLFNKDKDDVTNTVPNNTTQQVVQQNETLNIGVSSNNGNSTSGGLGNAVSNQQTSQKPDTNNGWVEFSGSNQLILNNEPLTTKFTVTAVKHYAKVLEGELRIKSMLTGALAGYSGTYEIEVPYSLGSKCSVGLGFDVNIVVGTLNGKTVIADIIYY